MSTLSGYAYHPLNGSKEPIYSGWNWPAFFFGIFWCMAKGLWALAGIIFLVILVTILVPVLGWLVAIGSWLYLGANGNDLYAKHLSKQGYLSEEQHATGSSNSEYVGPARLVSAPEESDAPHRDTLADLERLQALRDRGTLTDEEFQHQKAKLLG